MKVRGRGRGGHRFSLGGEEKNGKIEKTHVRPPKKEGKESLFLEGGKKEEEEGPKSYNPPSDRKREERSGVFLYPSIEEGGDKGRERRPRFRVSTTGEKKREEGVFFMWFFSATEEGEGKRGKAGKWFSHAPDRKRKEEAGKKLLRSFSVRKGGGKLGWATPRKH